MHQPTPQQSQYLAWQLTRRAASDSIESLAATLVDAQVDLNPHQVDAALFACRNPLSRGIILADEVGLGKTIEAGLVIAQRRAERRHKILIITPANLRKQWHQELQDKFGLTGIILESKNYNALRKRLAPVCKRTQRQQVQPYVSYTKRRAIVQEFTLTDEERELSHLVADYLRRPNLKALPEGQRQLISLVLWKLLASSSRAIAGALATMAERLQTLLDSGDSEALAQSLDEDYEGLADTADEWEGDEDESALASSERATIAAEIAELRR